MTGLRERQKIKRRKNMLKAALKLFRERGYDVVKLEEVAEEADVSAGTVYTYFKTKNALLLAVIVQDFDDAYLLGNEILTQSPKDAVDTMNKLCRCYFYEDEGDVSRRMWCFAVSAFLREPDSEFGQQYAKCLAKMRDQFEAAIRQLQEKQLLSPNCDHKDLASVLFNNANYSYIEYLRDESISMDDLMARLERSNISVLDWAGA